MKKYRVIFCGTPNISVAILESLLKLNLEIVGVISQPDKPIGRKKQIASTPVKLFALANNLKVFQPLKIIEALENIKNLQPDFLITCAYGQIIPEKFLNLFKNCINVHASLLPKYRGGSPIQYAIMNGEKVTGISLMQMVKKMDAGQVYVQEQIDILNEYDNGVLFEKMAQLGSKMIKKYLIDILDNKISGNEQLEEEVTFAMNLKSHQEEIDWNMTAIDVVNFIRSQSPTPIAFSFIDGIRYKIKKARVVLPDEKYISVMKIFFPGEVITTDKEGIFVQCKEGIVKILEIQKEGKQMVNAGTYHNQSSTIHLGKKFGNL